MDYKDLEDEFVEAIQRCCSTEEDKEKAIAYFKGCTVRELIEEALED